MYVSHTHRAEKFHWTNKYRPTQLRIAEIRNSYTIPTRAVWDLLTEPEGESSKSHMLKEVWYNYFKAYYSNASALL